MRASAWRWIKAAALVVTLVGGYHVLLIAQAWLVAILAVVLYVAFGGVLALIAWPAVRALEDRRVPGPLAIAVVVVGGLLPSSTTSAGAWSPRSPA